MRRLRPFRSTLHGVVLASLATAGILATVRAQESLDVRALRDELRTATNAARADHGLPPLADDVGLARAAQAHIEENAARGVLDHGSPDPARDTPLERAGRAGVALVEVGENLALEPRDAVARLVVAGWLNSPPHRANLLDPAFTHVGFGVANGVGGVYVAQLFATRISDRIGASARPERRELATWRLDLRAPVGTEAMVFVGSRPVAAAVFDGPTASVTVDASAAPVDVVLGVKREDGRYAVSDRATLGPAGRRGSDDDGPFGEASIDAVHYDTSVEEGVTIEIAYEDESLPLQLLVDGEHLPGVLPRAGVLRTWLPTASERREIEVGLLLAGGAIRIVERFTLTGGADPSLLPGNVASERTAP